MDILDPALLLFLFILLVERIDDSQGVLGYRSIFLQFILLPRIDQQHATR